MNISTKHTGLESRVYSRDVTTIIWHPAGVFTPCFLLKSPWWSGKNLHFSVGQPMPFATSPSHHHFYRWYVYHSQSWVVYLWHCLVLTCFNHLVIQHSHGKSPFLIGTPSINGPFPMAMLVYQRVTTWFFSSTEIPEGFFGRSWVGSKAPIVKVFKLLGSSQEKAAQGWVSSKTNSVIPRFFFSEMGCDTNWAMKTW